MAFADVIAKVKELTSKIDPEKIKGMNAVYQFDLSGSEGGVLHIKVADGTTEVVEGAYDNPNITISMSKEDYDSMLEGKLNATSAFMAGKLKIKGDMSLAMKLQSIFS